LTSGFVNKFRSLFKNFCIFVHYMDINKRYIILTREKRQEVKGMLDSKEFDNNINPPDEGSVPNGYTGNTDRATGEYHYKNGFTQKIYSDAHYVPADENTVPPRYYTPPEKPVKEPAPPKKKNGGSALVRTICICLICAILGSAGGAAIAYRSLSPRIEQLEASVSELDEHVWTSIDNAVTIMDKIRGAVISEDVSLTETVTANYAAYKEELIKLDEQFKDTVKSARRNMIIVADRFPFQYLTEKYGIEYVAAFSGCSSDTEPTLSMINYLIEQVKLQDIPAVLKIEFSDGKTAEAVASETGCGILELHSAHNVTTEDFDAGVTYADLMRRNLETLRVALN